MKTQITTEEAERKIIRTTTEILIPKFRKMKIKNGITKKIVLGNVKFGGDVVAEKVTLQIDIYNSGTMYSVMAENLNVNNLKEYTFVYVEKKSKKERIMKAWNDLKKKFNSKKEETVRSCSKRFKKQKKVNNK